MTLTSTYLLRMTTSRPEVRLNRPLSISSAPTGLGECPLRFAGAHHRTSQRKHLLRQPGSCSLYEYDSRQHRIKKTVTHLAANKGILPKIYQYNDSNRITPPNTTHNTIIYSCIEALDLSGAVQNAGGLSVVKEASQTTQFVANQLIGNVLGLFNTPTGNNSARYEYGPFGELIRATGPMAKLNPFRFSTKYQDDEADLLYYGYRYYSANTGRWLSRDPIGEKGGRNLYGFVSNEPTDKVDKDGRSIAIPLTIIAEAVVALVACTAAVEWVNSPAGHQAIQNAVASATSVVEAISRSTAEAIEKCERCLKRTKGCLPCNPGVGTMMGQPDANPGHGVDGPHIDLLLVLQTPYPACRCFRLRHFVPPVPGTTLPPGIEPVQDVSGGGPIP
jgi:RHS repeat-associated protein